MDIDNVRRVFNIMKANSGEKLTELHSHCTTGWPGAVYVEAMN